MRAKLYNFKTDQLEPISDVKEKTKVAICISTYNDYKLTDYLLTTIRRFTEYPEDQYKICVLDDGSKQTNLMELRSVLKKHDKKFPNFYYLEHPENMGITKTWNDLVNFFDSEYTVVLNNDVLVTKYWLTALVYFLENTECAGASLPCWYYPVGMVDAVFANMDKYEIRIIDPNTKEPLRNQPYNYVEKNESRPGRVMCAAGMLFGFRTKIFNEVGGFDERTHHFYNEMEFFTKICRDKNLCCYALPFPNCYHVWSYTFKNNPELESREHMTTDRQAYKEMFGGDINPRDPNNTHRRFMPHVPPKLIKWLAWDSIQVERESKTTGQIHNIPKMFYQERQYQETDQDVVEAAKT